MLPKDVKKMSLARFKEEFGDNIGAINKSAASRAAAQKTAESQ